MDQFKLKGKHELSVEGAINFTVWGIEEYVLGMTLIKALQQGVSRYSIYRELKFAARIDLDKLFDDLALNLNCAVHRIDSIRMIMDFPNALVTGYGGRTAEYSSCTFRIWAGSPNDAETIRITILDHVGDMLIRDPMFSIRWHFLTSQMELKNVDIEEMADDILYDEAYPYIESGIDEFINSYLDADESVLVIQGPPGTGKTRLIRAILGEMSRKKSGKATAIYTGDKKALESDEIFVRFITGWDDAFIIEDADHLIKPRAEGNENLHRFLTLADGVIRAQGRKIMFTTNLPNVGDLDDAIVRPGRCFAHLVMRELNRHEAKMLINKLCSSKMAREQTSVYLDSLNSKSYSLANIYKAISKFPEPDQLISNNKTMHSLAWV